MRALRFDTAAFVAAYNAALQDGVNQQILAKRLGITYSCLNCRKHQLKRRGISLPPLPRKPGSGRRKAAKQVLRLIAPVSVRVEPAPLSFTMTVGCGHG